MSSRWKRMCLAAAAAVCTTGIYADAPSTFSLADSVLLFGTYNDLRAVSPGDSQSIKPPESVNANQGYFAYPSISPRGDLIAWGFAREAQQNPDHRARFTLGIYSLRDHRWAMHGDFDSIGASSFSSDGLRVAFEAEQDGKKQLLILDLSSGIMKSTPHPTMWYRTSLSWSPDSKHIVLSMTRPSKNNPFVAILDLETGEVRSLGEGLDPTWSPTGEWIAYFDPPGANCLIAHPDGTGVRIVKKVRQSWLSYRRLGWGGPVWSPDGGQLLLSEMKGDGNYIGIELLDLASGRAQKKTGDGLPVFGWASQHN